MVVTNGIHSPEIPIQEAGAVVPVDPLPIVMADRPLFEQVVTNLIGNAITYRWPDVPAVIQIPAIPQGSWWDFAARDNGIGIEAEYFTRILETFSGSRPWARTRGPGSALLVSGLYPSHFIEVDGYRC